MQFVAQLVIFASVAHALVAPPSSSLKNIEKRMLVRGGALADYSGAAAELFNNMRAPAALVGGSIVPMGFAATPEIKATDSALVKRLKQIHMIVAILSLSAEIVAVTYSTIAINKLSETVVAPTASVTELLKRDYELQWLGCNVNFLAGLLGFTSLLGLRAWFSFGPKLGRVGVLAAASVLTHCMSVINRGISLGDGTGSTFGSNFFGLCRRYLVLQTTDTFKSFGVLQFMSIALLGGAIYSFSKISPHDK